MSITIPEGVTSHCSRYNLRWIFKLVGSFCGVRVGQGFNAFSDNYSHFIQLWGVSGIASCTEEWLLVLETDSPTLRAN